LIIELNIDWSTVVSIVWYYISEAHKLYNADHK
jgi:hypothetical protein